MNINENKSNNTTSNISLNEAKSLAALDKLTLRQLRSVLPETKDIKTPSRDWVREHLTGDEVFYTKEYGDGRLTVFINGFFHYSDGRWETVLRVDGFKELYYETDAFGSYEKLHEADFIDTPIDYPLIECALWQLKRNAEKRLSSINESSVDMEIIENNPDENNSDVLQMIIEREEKTDERKRLYAALNNLTPAQREVIVLRYWKKMTIDQIADYIGRSRNSVKDRLTGAIKAIKRKI